MRGRKVEGPGLAGAAGNHESREGITLQIGMPLAQVSRRPRGFPARGGQGPLPEMI